MKVLVVDDSRAIRALLTRILENSGHTVYSAGHGAEALEVLAEQDDIDFVMVDWNMPVMDGLSFVENVRSQSCYAGLHIMMITTEVELEQVERALNAGANEYLMKPFGEEELLARMEMLTGSEGE